MRWLPLCLMLSACTGVAWNNRVAETAAVRQAMVASVRVGVSTEGEVIARWGRPTQIMREGAQRSLIWRDMRNPGGLWPLRYGDSTHYVIVAFQYGIATGALSSDSDGCRATFPPWPPGPGFDTPSTVHPAGVCPGVTAPEEIAAGPQAGAVQDGAGPAVTADGRPGVPADLYRGPGKGGR